MKFLVFSSVFAIFNFSVSGQNISCTVDSNNRTRITELNVPNAYTCYMEMTRGNSIRYGTGFLIHPRVLLSAGHNFAWYPSGSVTEVKVYFGSIDNVTYLASDTISLKRNDNKFFKSGYWSNGKIHRDFAIVILPDSSIYKKIGGCYKIFETNTNIKPNPTINITGSPGDKENFEMWTSATSNYGIQTDKVLYDMYTEVRNSGSPIWFKKGNDYFVIGVHSRSWGDCRAATLLTSDVVNQIKNWCLTQNINL